MVGTSRCDVRAACSGATPSHVSVARIDVPAATTRAGTARRAIPTFMLNRCGQPCPRDFPASAPFRADTAVRAPVSADSCLAEKPAAAFVCPGGTSWEYGVLTPYLFSVLRTRHVWSECAGLAVAKAFGVRQLVGAFARGT